MHELELYIRFVAIYVCLCVMYVCARLLLASASICKAKRLESRSNAEMCGILRRSCGLTSLCMKNTSIKKRENVGKSEDVLYTKDLNVDDK